MLPAGNNPQISSKLNEPILINRVIKGISYCYHCKSKELIYDEMRDEIICKSCGTVLRQGLKDYESIIIKNSEKEDTTFREHLNKNYLDDLQIIQK